MVRVAFPITFLTPSPNFSTYAFIPEGFPSGSMIKNPPDNQEMQFRFLGWEDPLEQEMATHSSVLDWEISQREEPGGLQPMGSQKNQT